MMRREFKILTLGIMASVIVGIFIGSNFLVTPSTTSVSGNDETAFLTYHAKVCKKVTRADGTVEDLGCSKNLFNTDGMNYTQNLLSGVGGNGSTGLLRFIAVGNKTGTQCGANQYATNSFLCGEYASCGLSRGLADAVRLNTSVAGGGSSGNVTAGNWTITKEFTANQAGCDVNATGLFNTTTVNESDEAFFAQNTFTTATLQTNDKINVTWFIWVT